LINPGQQDAHLYGSAFSRGAVVQQHDFTWMEISGTAAIDEMGQSLYPGDIRAQIMCTLDKLEMLLGQKGAGLANICTASVFIKHPQYAQVFLEIIRQKGLDDFPGVCVIADVCRDELLFEIDAQAIL
jgi:enamine deaminase RidA (YjgF/YER057c/UK114 family)